MNRLKKVFRIVNNKRYCLIIKYLKNKKQKKNQEQDDSITLNYIMNKQTT